MHRLATIALLTVIFAAPLAAEEIAPAPVSKLESAARMELPAGFQATLFAGEPDVRQPIAFALDDRGRLWVAECYAYPNWKATGHDRILILEDTDGDGQFDQRKVFWDKANYLTGIEIGFGGVWVCCAPELLFIPDEDHNDVPDGEPQVVLDGWSNKGVHNVVNGLKWGPDGWLWGLNGITAPSFVGRPGASNAQRKRLNCSVWRYHPLDKRFEVVAHGTTNPWGLDFDDYGQAFITNCVIAHLWHVVPGAHFQRMFGEDYNPHVYGLMSACADHLHWGGGDWRFSRGGRGAHSIAGGGHAHAGAMIYLGDNWPDEYRNSILTCNIHGNRVNRDTLRRRGSGYVGHHADDFLLAHDTWFRGLELKCGPDGGVYVTDWSDTGECHERDAHGSHHESGRIYKVTHGRARPPANLDVGKQSDQELVQLQLHKNDWYVRHARRNLQERFAAGADMRAVHQSLRRMFTDQAEISRKLRALWALHVTGGASADFLQEQLQHESEYVRGWAIRLLCEDNAPPEAALRRFADLGKSDPSPWVRLRLASALQRLPLVNRWPISQALLAHHEDSDDKDLPLMLWYAVEPLVEADTDRAVALAVACQIPLVRTYVARRAADAGKFSPLMELLRRLEGDTPRLEALTGIYQSLEGRKNVGVPKTWPALYKELLKSDNPRLREQATLVSLVLGDPNAVATLRRVTADRAIGRKQRENALRALTQYRIAGLGPLLDRLVDEPQMRAPALRALATLDTPDTPGRIIALYPKLNEAQRSDAIHTLASRPNYALAMLEAMGRKEIPSGDLSAFSARGLLRFKNPRIEKKLNEVWGAVRQTSKQKTALMAKYKAMLTPEAMKRADLQAGHASYKKICGQCHKLFGEGGDVGPDLTGSQRANLDYLLENALDPNALIGSAYKLTNVLTDDGRLISGIVLRETGLVLTLRTVNETVVLRKDDIETRAGSNVSMMPEGIFEKLRPEEVRDLVGWLRLKSPPRPAAQEASQ